MNNNNSNHNRDDSEDNKRKKSKLSNNRNNINPPEQPISRAADIISMIRNRQNTNRVNEAEEDDDVSNYYTKNQDVFSMADPDRPPSIREYLDQLRNDQTRMRRHPLYDEGYQAGIRAAEDRYRKITAAIATFYDIDRMG